MSVYIHYEDIPRPERKQLSKEEFRKDRATRLWSALSVGISFALGFEVSSNSFPDKSDWPGRLIYFVLFCVGLSALFHEAIVKPRIIRLVEKRKNSS